MVLTWLWDPLKTLSKGGNEKNSVFALFSSVLFCFVVSLRTLREKEEKKTWGPSLCSCSSCILNFHSLSLTSLFVFQRRRAQFVCFVFVNGVLESIFSFGYLKLSNSSPYFVVFLSGSLAFVIGNSYRKCGCCLFNGESSRFSFDWSLIPITDQFL
ncbi:hypothetical protein Csa_014605 [Cucumis sativus]|uniref:Uncharacterized protein n=1 Tax=Cucumis sativus TaxID=3659 RepID=A0A0A0KVR9_CUCSA|nr:hypothetical protein Csa_014605 [Cucumis sativus]